MATAILDKVRALMYLLKILVGISYYELETILLPQIQLTIQAVQHSFPNHMAAAILEEVWWLMYLLKLLVSISYQDLDTILLPEIQLTIQAVQHSSPNHKAQFARWLERLKEAYYDAEDILDGLEYERLRRKVESKVSVRSPIIKPLAKFVNPAFKRPSLLYTLKKKLLDRLKKLKEIAAEAKTFHDLLGIHNTESKDAIITGNNSAVTSSFLIGKVFGRDGDRDAIINFLLDKEGDGSSLTKSYSVVAVTGIGGVGKTTLAQYVYNDKRVKNHFGVRMWLCVSKKFNIINLLKEMIECASEKECPNLSSLDVLQDKLMETLPKSDNIMVVLDDVWYDNNDEEVGENKWENLLKPLIKFASRGGTCKIVVTSRSTSFPFALLPGKLIELSDLAPNDFISLLRYHAIDGLQINDPQLKNDLSDIVDKLRLLEPLAPLVAKVVGNQLCEQPDIEFWQATLGNVNLSTDGVIAGENLDALQNKLIVLDDVWWSDLAPDDGWSQCDNDLALLLSKPFSFSPVFPDDGWSQCDNDLALLLSKPFSFSPVFPDDFISLTTSSALKYVQLNTARLENGLGAFKYIIFEDNSSWTRSGFQLGVMVKGEGEEEGYFSGERVREGVNESFWVIERQEKVPRWYDFSIWGLLKLKDDVRCLKKDEKYYASLLQKNNIKTVEDFLKLYYNDEPALRKILCIKSESDEGWKSMVEHDLQCANKYHAKYNDLNNSSHCVLGKKKKEMEKKHLLISSISGGERGGEKATLLITHKSSARLLPREDAPAVEEETVELEAEEREDSDSDSEIGESKIYDVWVQGEHSVVSEEVRDASLCTLR